MPSCMALWASMAPPATSPTAKIFSSVVRLCWSTIMNPRSFTLTFVFSRPIPSEFGTLPDGHEHAVESLVLLLDFPAESHVDAALILLERGHARIEVDGFKERFEPGRKRSHQVRIDTAHELSVIFDEDHLASQATRKRTRFQVRQSRPRQRAAVAGYPRVPGRRLNP